MRHLHETDLANTAVLPVAEQPEALRRVTSKAPPVNYRPLRRKAPDIFNAIGDLIGEARPGDIESIRERIRRDSFTRNEATKRANIEAAESLHGYAIEHGIRARRYLIPPFNLPGAVGITLVYWSPLVLIKDDRPHVMFIDPRREHGLTAEGRRFAFSMMHHRARVLDPDLAKAELVIFQFPMAADGRSRTLVDYLASELARPLFEYEELEERIRATYNLWRIVLAEGAEEMRKRADRDRGNFGLSA
jgi:hypothetical protein